MTEYEIIRSMAAKHRRSKDQLNQLFECDAELIKIGDQVWGLTMDDFSPAEDLFTCADPSKLGANLAVATISDLLAAGVEPKFFMHAVSLPDSTESSFIEGLSEGIETILRQAGCTLCGGDLGKSDAWRYCGFCMGPVVSPKPLTHRVPKENQTLWVTGKLGDANLAAVLKSQTPSFELRLNEAAVIRKHATACIDTSGGLMDALWLLHAMSPGVRFDLHTEKIPLAPGIREASAHAGFPAEAALLGGAGEYELLFTTQKDLSKTELVDMAALGITPIADVIGDSAGGIHIRRNGREISQMTDPPPCPRSSGSIAEHIKAVMTAAVSLFRVEP
jgi:thiamine-monophosphate kinase